MYLKNEQTELTDFLHSGTGSRKLKGDINFLGMVSGNRCGQSGGGTPKLTVFEEWTDGINWFMHVDTDSQKLKADQCFFRQVWSKMSVTSLVMEI